MTNRCEIRWAATAAAVGLALVGAGCGGSRGPASSDRAMTRALDYSHCMRSHGISNFPDPTTPAGGGVTFQIDAGRGSDLSQRSPAFQAADRACRSLLAAGRAAPPVSGPQLAQEVKWARCLRSHGLPGFPDPNGQGAFDSAGFDPESPRFAAASAVCRAEQPSGAISAAPGPRP